MIKIKKVSVNAMTTSSGKTTFTLGLLQLLSEKGKVRPFKIGPDFIDPMFHTAVTGTRSVNLDSFFEDKISLKKRFSDNAVEYDYAIMEGVMGHLDGLKDGKASSDEVAGITETPVTLLVEEIPSVRTMAAMIDGVIRNSRSEIKSVIITKSKSQKLFEMQKSEIESLTGIKVAGRLPYSEELEIPSRHLGLNTDMSILNDSIRSISAHCSKLIAENIDVDSLFEDFEIDSSVTNKSSLKGIKKAAVSRDEAFCFCYDANIEWLKDKGYEIIYFSPLHDKYPPDADLYYLCGGYPELFLHQINDNSSMRKSMLEICENGINVIAECGGYMYLCQNIENVPMVGFFGGDAKIGNRMNRRFGYENITILENCFFQKGTILKGHEFHYGYIENLREENALKIVKASNESTFLSGEMRNNVLGSFTHFYFPSCKGEL